MNSIQLERFDARSHGGSKEPVVVPVARDSQRKGNKLDTRHLCCDELSIKVVSLISKCNSKESFDILGKALSGPKN